MAILLGTQSNGETLPVLVDQFGNLLAKGIEGETGPPGPPGAPGVGELPSGATDGALLGWQDGELVWVTEPLPPVLVPGFVPVLYTGNGGTQSITTGFSPDLVWVKSTSDAYSHSLQDTIQGTGSYLSSNKTNAATAETRHITSFDSNGFTLGSGSGVNESAKDYTAWCWDAGDTTVTNNEGSIESQVRSNGNFSVVSYTGLGTAETVGHGLDKTPSMVIVKSTESISNWRVWHEALGNPSTQTLFLNTQSGATTDSGFINVVFNTTFGVTGNGGVGALQNHIAYCWAETQGVTSFGSYSGSGARQTINTGFRPSLVMIKSTGTGNWFMFDNARGASKALYANEDLKEEETGAIEFLDDGFQLLFALPGVNQSNETYIYAAFANPSDAAFAQRQLRRQARQEERQQNETQPR